MMYGGIKKMFAETEERIWCQHSVYKLTL